LLKEQHDVCNIWKRNCCLFLSTEFNKKGLMMQKRKKEAVTRKRAGNIIAKINRTKGQTTNAY
jgi:hypothetical protein